MIYGKLFMSYFFELLCSISNPHCSQACLICAAPPLGALPGIRAASASELGSVAPRVARLRSGLSSPGCSRVTPGHRSLRAGLPFLGTTDLRGRVILDPRLPWSEAEALVAV